MVLMVFRLTLKKVRVHGVHQTCCGGPGGACTLYRGSLCVDTCTNSSQWRPHVRQAASAGRRMGLMCKKDLADDLR